MVVFTGVKKRSLSKLKGISAEDIKSIHEEGRWVKKFGKKEVVLVLYTSGKLLLQGDLELKEKVAGQLRELKVGEEVKLVDFKAVRGWVIGSDESLKGDTFGGLVVAGVKANDNIRKQLRELGVADSKKLADKEILIMAEKVKKIGGCYVLNVFPEEYNTEVRKGNLTKLMNKLHQEVYDYLKPGKHIVDKFPGCYVGEIAETKAEDKYLEVAAASVVARAAALKQLDALSAKAGFLLPKGSTHVKMALHELKERKLDFKEFVKVDFKNVREFL